MYGELTLHQIDDDTAYQAIKLRIPFPVKAAYVRMPTTKEMVEYLKPVKKNETDEGKALSLFKSIRLDDGPEFDQFEASNCMNSLCSARSTSYERIGDSYRITIDTPFGECDHTVSVPTMKQVAVFRRSVHKAYIPAACDLYDLLHETHVGYAEGVEVPPHHKYSVVNSVFEALDSIDPLIEIKN